MEFPFSRYSSGDQHFPDADNHPPHYTEPHAERESDGTHRHYYYQRNQRSKYKHSRKFFRRRRRLDRLLRVIFTFIIQLLGLLWILGYFD